MTQVFAGQRVTAGTLSQDYTFSDTTNFAVTGTGLNPLSQTWTLPASDANVGTFYRLSCWGNGVWGSTARSLTLQMTFAGSAFGGSGVVVIDASDFSASAIFRWNAVLLLQCQETGSNGQWHGTLSGCLTQTANNIIVGTTANNSVPFAAGPSATVTQDSTVANPLLLEASWASVSGAPTITCRGTTFERCGG